MTAKILLYAMVAFIACACAQMPPGSPPPGPPPAPRIQDCPGASCDVQVSVVCNPLCWIDVADRITVPRGNSPMIRWEIVTPGYKFFGTGIWFSLFAPFDCHLEGEQSTRVACKDTYKGTDSYKYTIMIVGAFPKDPWVDNQ